MFSFRTVFAALALIVGSGSASQAQMPRGGNSFGQRGGLAGFQSGFPGQSFGAVSGAAAVVGPAFPYGYGYGYYYDYGAPLPIYGAPSYDYGSYPVYGYGPALPQTYNAMGSLMNSIQRSASRRGGWR